MLESLKILKSLIAWVGGVKQLCIHNQLKHFKLLYKLKTLIDVAI